MRSLLVSKSVKKSSNKVAVIAAHPDDEVLGCGATMAKHAKAGDEVHVLILTEGLRSRDNMQPPKNLCDAINTLKRATKKANDILGVASLLLHSFPDNRLDGIELLEIVRVIENFINQHQPNIVYTHHVGDVNIDHRQTNQAVITACRSQPNHPVKRLLFFEIASSTEWQPPSALNSFQPNWFVDVTHTLALKCEALKAYKSEMRAWPHARSIKALEHLARWRGSIVGTEAAESFMLGRTIE